MRYGCLVPGEPIAPCAWLPTLWGSALAPIVLPPSTVGTLVLAYTAICLCLCSLVIWAAVGAWGRYL
jgi:hypothetical protein